MMKPLSFSLAFLSIGIVSILDGKSLKGCEVTFETDESMISGDTVYQKFQSFADWQGWFINEMLMADGPGSSTISRMIKTDALSIGHSIHGSMKIPNFSKVMKSN